MIIDNVTYLVHPKWDLGISGVTGRTNDSISLDKGENKESQNTLSILNFGSTQEGPSAP